MSYRQSQGGSTAIFVIVAVVLGVLALGALYWARNYASSQGQGLFAGTGESSQEAPADDGKDQAANKDKSSESSAQNPTNDGNDGNKNQSTPPQDTNTPPSQKDNGPAATPRQESGQAESSAGNTDGGSRESQAPDSSRTTPSGDGSGDGSLPQTGPADTLLSLVMLGSLAGVTTAYIRSRR